MIAQNELIIRLLHKNANCDTANDQNSEPVLCELRTAVTDSCRRLSEENYDPRVYQ